MKFGIIYFLKKSRDIGDFGEIWIKSHKKYVKNYHMKNREI